ncbi:uncharacterized protein LOC114797141 [Denticeps clupeoides]|uniref:uncharacterized protein LOC114797141 n=1 Tax=Denticeps clupeoides TaxID=299321 RepID=UPI0010A30FAC|nr:uncharacterized protein LOC114797141 [Denticeps clupeoides]
MKLQPLRVPLLLLLLLCWGEYRASQARFGRLDRWVRAGFQYLKLHLCRRASLSEAECKRLSHLHLSAVAVYASESGADRVLAVLPDSQSAGAPEPSRDAHDAVLVLDPSPGETFGHPLGLFYVDFNVTKKRCGHMDGIYLGEECLTLAMKTRCVNQLKRRRGRSDHARVRRSGRAERGGGLCETHFLPLVVGVRDGNRTQRLRCVDHPDFARCPLPLPLASPSVPMSSCELNKNTRRCHQQPLATHLSCRLYQTCDHAVLLSGGWQQQITFQRHVQNLQLFYKMLRNNGFHKDHIKTFFAGNGQVAAKETEGVYPATEKESIRNHVSYICRKQHCADSLVLYLNSPTRNDGTMLLWDRNGNGVAELKERYSVGELLSDLAGCRARRVLLFVEQSYSGALSKRLRGSAKHPNVLLLSALPWVAVAESWASLLPTQCLIDHLSKNAVMPHLRDTAAGQLNVTLAGAPCNSTPALTEAEMRREYMGCQNLPTALWHQSQRRTQEQSD